MKNHIFFLYFISAISLGFGQEGNTSIPSTVRSVKNIVEVKETAAIDSLTTKDSLVVTQIGNKELKTATVVDAVEKDSTALRFKDNPKLSKIDSLWRQELFSANLFDTIYRTVTEQTYEPIEYVDLPTDTLKARLAELNTRTPFNVEYNKSLESVIKNYLKNRKEAFERLMGLSYFYFPLFEQELDNHNIPLEIKYLAIIESALKPRAKSRVGATGLWQFMFGTGKMYGLEVSSYVDERMDPIMSTRAACKYLAKLYSIFGDWDLALASYNSGPGNVNKAIRRSGGYTNYWNIRHNLPRETAGYLPAFLATMYIFEYADKHDLIPQKPRFNYIETDTIKVKQMITLDQVSEYLDINIEEVQFLNPSYKLDIIPYIKDEDYVLRLPTDKAGVFAQNEDQIYAKAKAELDKREKPLPKYYEANDRIRYRVRSGDYLGRIARKFGVRVSQIRRWNRMRNDNLKVGQRLTIYPRRPVVRESSSVSTNKETNVTKQKTTPKGSYIVKSGDTLWSISQKFKGVTVDNLRKWNDIRGSGIKPGMRLKVTKS